ncbi:helix-turn-helix domain-containing protein (plasmid) [Azospirillum argentinense]|uniref:Helix-turn-helix domain-containing protein n=1 Tax=Azospirillum argentinense TaxID=2970906 RepID=A0A4D8PN21_9PROT|nr:helix-turn-helix domain-containing protein [Azospirillum argentinense]QCN99532.1 helix-turn-helix domain-containing protein [Azospirillum argentinense]
MTSTTDTASRWGKIPAWWLDHPDLDADGFAVLAALATFADENGVCWPSQSTLAAKLKRSRPTINRILQRLDDMGLVGIEHRRGRDGSRLSCLYRLRIAQNEAAPQPQPQPQLRPVRDHDRDDSPANAPCPTPSQEQLHPEQIPDSHASGGRQPVRDVPEDWMPTATDFTWARSRFGTVDLGRHVEGFVLRCQAHGYRYRDISAAWKAWLSQDVAAGKAPADKTAPPAAGAIPGTIPGVGHARQSVAEQRVNAWMAVADRLKDARLKDTQHTPSHTRPRF